MTRLAATATVFTSTSRVESLRLGALALLVLAACSQPAPEPPGEPVRVESTALGLAVAALPAALEVETTEGEILVLRGPGGSVLTVEAGPEERGGINLVAAARGMKEEYEARPGGEFFGNRELITPGGAAFTARGAWEDDSGQRLEETLVLALHPTANRLLTLTYTYPAADDSQERVGQLLELVGELEPLPLQPAAPIESE